MCNSIFDEEIVTLVIKRNNLTRQSGTFVKKISNLLLKLTFCQLDTIKKVSRIKTGC